MDHITIPALSPAFLRAVEVQRVQARLTFKAWVSRRGFEIVKDLEFWYTQAHMCRGWFRATIVLPDGTTRRVYDGGSSPEGWRMGNRPKKKAAVT